jgi:hypothetical protein
MTFWPWSSKKTCGEYGRITRHAIATKGGKDVGQRKGGRGIRMNLWQVHRFSFIGSEFRPTPGSQFQLDYVMKITVGLTT